MASSNGNISRVTGPLWGEFTGHLWIPLTKTSDVELWCFLWSTPEQTVEQTIETPVIWDAIAPYDVTVMLYYSLAMNIISDCVVCKESCIFILVIMHSCEPYAVNVGHSLLMCSLHSYKTNIERILIISVPFASVWVNYCGFTMTMMEAYVS